MPHSIDIVFIGLAITSSWGNGHATTYRSLLKGLHERGHRVTFLERDQPWYAGNRDAPELPYCEVHLYSDLNDLRRRFRARVRAADAVIVGSYVKEGREVCQWVIEHAQGVRGFYDIDTPVTLSRLGTDACDYLRVEQVPQFDMVLSFTGGPTLRRLETAFGARRAVPLYCSVDVDRYRPQHAPRRIELGYMGTYSGDRQPGVEALLNGAARRRTTRQFAVVGSQYPPTLHWPKNVRRIDHLAPAEHTGFYCQQRYTLNLTRADMRRAGYSPSVRLFEAAACGTPIISDEWPGLADVLVPGEEILIARTTEDVVAYLQDMTEKQRQRIARAAREHVLSDHGGSHRAAQFESYVESVRCDLSCSRRSDNDTAARTARSCVLM